LIITGKGQVFLFSSSFDAFPLTSWVAAYRKIPCKSFHVYSDFCIFLSSGWELEIMETQVNDSEDETEGAGRGSSTSIRVGRSTRVTEIKTRAHFDLDVNAPNCVPISASSNAQGPAGNAPTANGVTVSVDSGDDEGPSNQVARDDAQDDQSRTPETRATALCSPSVHKSIATPIQVNNIENINANCLKNSSLVTANNLLWPNPPEENLSRAILHSSELSIKVDKKDDGHTPDLNSTVRQLHIEETPKLCESSVRSEGNSTSQNNHILGYSRRCSSKSVSPDANLRSAQQTALSQSSKGKMSGIDFYNPPRKHDQDFSDPADARSLQEAEVVKHVDRSGSALIQRRKSIISSVCSKLPNGDPGSGTEVLSSLISSKESASEGATVSNLNKNSAGCTNVGGHLNSVPTEKQMSGSFKSNLLSSRRTSLKLASSGKAKRLSENSFNDKNMEASGEVTAPALHEATPEKGCAIFPSVNSEVRKESSGVSLQNGNTGMSDTEQVYKVDVAGLGLKSDKAVPHQSLEPSPGDIPVNAVIGQDTKTRAKASTSRVRRNAGTKRSRNAGSKTAAAFAKQRPEVAASKPMHDGAVPCENAEAQQGEKCSSPNAAEPESLSPEEILNGKPRNEASKSELVNVIPQKNTKVDHKNPSSSASADDNLEKSSLKVPDSAARNSVAEGPQTADGKAAEKSEIMSLKSNFSVVVPPENRETYPKKLSSSASADDPETYAANKVPNRRDRKVVAKRKMSAVQKQKFSSEPFKAAGVFVTEDKNASSERVAHNSRNAGKVTVDQDAQNTIVNKTKDPVGSFCKDTMEERSKDTQSSKSRSKKRQKTVDLVDGSMDYDKENIPVSCCFTSKTKYGNNSISSKSITKVLRNDKVELDKNRMIKGNDCGTLNVVEPTRFILSGHLLLRKEYKSILTRLKGRVCRDSHHWSFQATHLVATELRRTEKFFAAAAVGR
jgi:topoisomerase (DNA) II binding protein 1